MISSTPHSVLSHPSSVPPGEFTPRGTRTIPLTDGKLVRTEVEEEDVELLLQRYHESLRFIDSSLNKSKVGVNKIEACKTHLVV